jgi:hypothetical protein
MSRALTMPATAQTSRVFAAVDRFFPLAWIGYYFLLPTSGWAAIMFRSWADQERDLQALKSLLADGHAASIVSNAVGPAYIGTAALIHAVFRIDAERSLVVLTQGSYVLSVAAAMTLVGALVRRLTTGPPLVSLAAQFSLAALVFSAGTWHWSDVPWSHFYAAFLAVSVYAVRFAPGSSRRGYAAVIGALLALLSLTRSFEFAAVVLAWVIGAGLVFAFGIRRRSRPSGMNVLLGTVAFLGTFAIVYAGTGKRDEFVLYGNHIDEQRSIVAGQDASLPVDALPTFSPGYIPEKLVQLFVEPCYYAMCSVADYAGGREALPSQLAGASGQERLWRLPLTVQLPSLVLLPFCLLGVCAIFVWAVRHRRRVGRRARDFQAILEMVIAATGLVLGYTASTMIGSSHLRYGLARDFLLPALLTSIVAVTLISVGLWRVISRRQGKISAESLFVVLSVVGAAVVITGTTYARADGIPRLEARQLGEVAYTASCRVDRCEVSLEAKTTRGGPISIPETSTLTFECGDDTPRFTIFAASLSGDIALNRRCPDPRLVEAWPTVAGLPPGSYEVSKAVKIVNA